MTPSDHPLAYTSAASADSVAASKNVEPVLPYVMRLIAAEQTPSSELGGDEEECYAPVTTSPNLPMFSAPAHGDMLVAAVKTWKVVSLANGNRRRVENSRTCTLPEILAKQLATFVSRQVQRNYWMILTVSRARKLATWVAPLGYSLREARQCKDRRGLEQPHQSRSIPSHPSESIAALRVAANAAIADSDLVCRKR